MLHVTAGKERVSDRVRQAAAGRLSCSAYSPPVFDQLGRTPTNKGSPDVFPERVRSPQLFDSPQHDTPGGVHTHAMLCRDRECCPHTGGAPFAHDTCAAHKCVTLMTAVCVPPAVMLLAVSVTAMGAGSSAMGDSACVSLQLLPSAAIPSSGWSTQGGSSSGREGRHSLDKWPWRRRLRPHRSIRVSPAEESMPTKGRQGVYGHWGAHLTMPTERTLRIAFTWPTMWAMDIWALGSAFANADRAQNSNSLRLANQPGDASPKADRVSTAF
eukprot:359368-Chlamydomonas_euryale.AAC.2